MAVTSDVSSGDGPWAGAEEGKKYTFNSTELRAINVSMQLVQPLGGVPLNVVQQEARPRRAAAEQANARQREQQQSNPLRANLRAVVSAVHEQCAVPPDQLWEIPTGDESRIPGFCCP